MSWPRGRHPRVLGSSRTGRVHSHEKPQLGRVLSPEGCRNLPTPDPSFAVSDTESHRESLGVKGLDM